MPNLPLVGKIGDTPKPLPTFEARIAESGEIEVGALHSATAACAGSGGAEVSKGSSCMLNAGLEQVHAQGWVGVVFGCPLNALLWPAL